MIFSENFAFGDTRLNKRADELREAISNKTTVSIRKLADDRKTEKAFHRLLHHDDFTTNTILENAKIRSKNACDSLDHVLIVQDTSDCVYAANDENFRENIGYINDKSKGYRAHAAIAVDSTSGSVLGLTDLSFISRPKNDVINKKNKKSAHEDPSQRESQRWIDVINKSNKTLPKQKKTIVADREADNYRNYEAAFLNNVDIIFRNRIDKKLLNNKSLHEELKKAKVLGKSTIELPKTQKRAKRKAILDIKSIEIEILRPLDLKKYSSTESLKLTAVLAQEINYQGEDAIQWILITSHKVKSFENALQVIEWYRYRWTIEELFRTTKRKGLELESSLIEDPKALEKLISLAFSVSIQCMQLVGCRDGNDILPFQTLFSTSDIPLLEKLCNKLEGKSKLQKNPFPTKTLSWGGWVLARLGGWKSASKAERPPGPITYSCGIRKFNDIRFGYTMQ